MGESQLEDSDTNRRQNTTDEVDLIISEQIISTDELPVIGDHLFRVAPSCLLHGRSKERVEHTSAKAGGYTADEHLP